MPVTSLGGYLYHAIFVDECFHKTWIFFLKTKDQVFDVFRDLKARVENQTGNKIKIPRINNGGEYTSNEFKDFCREAKIKKEVIVPYKPQQNGVAKRKNKTIMEATKSMIHDQKLPMFLSGEATNIVVYV